MAYQPQPNQQQPTAGLPRVPYSTDSRDSSELVSEILDDPDVSEYRLKRGDRDELFEGLFDKSASLTILDEGDVEARYYRLEAEKDLLAMRLPRPGSPWTGELRARLMGDKDDELEPLDEIAGARNYRIAMDRARQSRKGGKLLELLMKTFNISQVLDGRDRKRRPWYKRIFPSRGGR